MAPTDAPTTKVMTGGGPCGGVLAHKGSAAGITLDGAMSAKESKQIYEMWLSQIGADSGAKRWEVTWYLAAVCAFGTSAERAWEEVTFDCSLGIVPASTLLRLLPPSKGDSAMRRFVRGLVLEVEEHKRTVQYAFADYTYFVLRDDSTLTIQLAMQNACAYDQAPVSFDYADRMTMRLAPNSRGFIHVNRSRKVGPGRSDFVASSSPLELSDAVTGGYAGARAAPKKQAGGSRRPTDVGGTYGV